MVEVEVEEAEAASTETDMAAESLIVCVDRVMFRHSTLTFAGFQVAESTRLMSAHW